MTQKPSQLAILGGEQTVPDGMIKKWPPVDEVDRRMVLDSLNGQNHAFGPNCKAFQDEFAAWNGNAHAIFTNSGTAALHMALVACGVGAGDHVLVPAYSWSSSATCVIHHNAIPIFVDIDFDTMDMDVDAIEAEMTQHTKAIIVVHLHGLAVDMHPVMDPGPGARAQSGGGRLPVARGAVPGAQGGHLRPLRRLQLQPEQVPVLRRGRHAGDRRRGDARGGRSRDGAGQERSGSSGPAIVTTGSAPAR